MARILTALMLITGLAGCSIKRIAVNKIGNALASGGSTYEQDDDPDLVGEALPFGLKLIESMLAESPRHPGLLLAAASGFTEYGYAFVDQRADQALTESLERGEFLRSRARRLYIRAHNYGLKGLEVRYPGLGAALESDPVPALARVRKQDIALLYWTAASQGLAISVSKDSPEMLAQLPVVEAIIHRVRELDETWGDGSVPEFLISLEGTRAGGKPEEKQEHMKRYFEQSLTLSRGARASLFVSYAENACVPAQNRAGFVDLLQKALGVDPDRKPENRLANLVAQRRARWLLGRLDELFVEAAPASQANQ